MKVELVETKQWAEDPSVKGTVTEDERAAVELMVHSLIATLDMDDNGVIDRQKYERFLAV